MKLLKPEQNPALRESITESREILYFVLDVLTQTFTVCSRKKLSVMEYYTQYVAVKNEVTNYFKFFLTEPQALKVPGEWQDDLTVKLIMCLFQLFSTSDCITSLKVRGLCAEV